MHRLAATVYFARSSGLDMTIEALRRETRIEQVNVFMRAIRASAAQPMAASDVGVMAVGLVAVLETAAACWLTQGRYSAPSRSSFSPADLQQELHLGCTPASACGFHGAVLAKGQTGRAVPE